MEWSMSSVRGSLVVFAVFTLSIFAGAFGDGSSPSTVAVTEETVYRTSFDTTTSEVSVSTETGTETSAESDLTSPNAINTTAITPRPIKNSSSNSSSSANSGNYTAPTRSPLLSKQKFSDYHGQLERDICVCDLTTEYCDVNCCCDKDCSQDDKSVFDHCSEEFRHYDTRYCDYIEHIYINNTIHKWEVNQNGLFCVIRSNLPPSYTLQRQEPFKTVEDAEFQKATKYSWPDPTFVSEDGLLLLNSTKSYQYGKGLWTINNGSVQMLSVPKSFNSRQCLTKEDVRYLVDSESGCSHIDISEENSALNAATYFANVTVIASPGLFNVSWLNHNISKDCPRNVCLTIDPKLCEENFQRCSKISKNSTRLRPSCRRNISTNTVSCSNLVQKLRYNIYHNGTKGVKRVDLMVIQSNVTYDVGQDVELWQSREIKFVWSDRRRLNYSSYLSGHPGYLMGKPILTAALVSERVHFSSGNLSTKLNASSSAPIVSGNNRTSWKLKVFRNPLKYPSNFMVLPMNVGGDCQLLDREEESSSPYMPTEFGVNTHVKCVVHGFMANNKNNSSTSSRPRDVCNSIQKSIFKYWSLDGLENDTLANRLVGQFGDANAYKESDWIRVMFRQDIGDVLNGIRSYFDNPSNRTVRCDNIATVLGMDVYYSRVDFANILNQNKILGTVFTFKAFKNLTFGVDLEESVFRFSISNIATQLSFFDVTTKKVRKLVEPPSFSIQLPHDFFYPFVRMDSGSPISTSPFFYLQLAMCCILVFAVTAQ